MRVIEHTIGRQRAIALVWQPSAAVIAGLWLIPMSGLVHAETPQGGVGGAVGLGNRGWSTADTSHGTSLNELELSARTALTTDYIYRGVTLSDHGPAGSASFEARFGSLYAGSTVASVKLPTQPLAEFTFAGGFRPRIATVDLDIRMSYFAYPGERSPGETDGTNYWETIIRGDKNIGEHVRVAAGYAYSPNVSNTGAWSQYAAAGVRFVIPDDLLPPKLRVSLSTAAGYSWFGNQASDLGGFRLPAYLNWQAGITFAYEAFRLDLRYHDTSLSKENCYVFTGDPSARPGGRVDPIANPDGLISNWCGATFVAKAWVVFN